VAEPWADPAVLVGDAVVVGAEVVPVVVGSVVELLGAAFGAVVPASDDGPAAGDVHAAQNSEPSPPATTKRRVGRGRSGVITSTLRRDPVACDPAAVGVDPGYAGRHPTPRRDPILSDLLLLERPAPDDRLLDLW
jgi:hypothetical protein